ncbi:phospholipase [Chryseobacterium sp. FH2]|uniref:carboxylesterase family protein n=1 Tax=Chryseobacterium sp. FH2 TaxID=1674291 RepID=UPI00065AB81E|nr:phospholipase [Chryseobacterium sp. FH2]KMQ68621.1 phospholipase [Chryseobacterium sp. FH2]
MHKKIKYIIFTLCLLAAKFSFAQIQNHNKTMIDSLTFAQTKATLNNLSTDKFLRRIYTRGNKELPYRLLLPKDYKSSKKYPLVITLHNSTRIGNDNEKQLEPLSRIWIRNGVYEKYKCFVLVPQFSERSSNYAENENGISISKPSEEVRSLLELITDLKKEYTNIDTGRVYLLGYSMGASTAQNMLSMEPKQFAALVSIAAVPDFSNLQTLKKKNIWLIHGEKDTDNPYNGSAELFGKLREGKKIIFTSYSELNHDNITIPLLLNEAIPKWLFQQHK